MRKLELVESIGKCPKFVIGCRPTFRVLRDAETKMPLKKATWYACPDHPSQFPLPNTVDEALTAREKWINGDYPAKKAGAKVIDSKDLDL